MFSSWPRHVLHARCLGNETRKSRKKNRMAIVAKLKHR